MFYLLAYGFMTIGAFAIVTLVRDADGEATHLSQWAGLGRRSPLVAGVFTLFLLAFAGIPLTSGFTSKFAVFSAAVEGGATPLVIVGVIASAVLAFPYLRIIVFMYLTEPAETGPSVVVPGAFTSAAVTFGVVATVLMGVAPQPLLELASDAARFVALAVAASRSGIAGIEFHDPELEAAVRAGLAGVEERLRAAVRSDDSLVTETALHLVQAGGKRFRPLVVLLAAAFGDMTAPSVVPAAVVVELTHLATLYHDDVMDEAVVRRGAVSANARWTNTVAILTGDFLFARASDILADLGPDAVRIQARTFERLVIGQIHETVGPPAGVDPVAALPGCCCAEDRVADRHVRPVRRDVRRSRCVDVDTLTAYGEIIGVAFQLSDDLLDIASDATESGKTPGTDLREGVPTLPVLYALGSHDPSEARLRELIAKPLDDDSLHAEALDLLRRSPAMTQARESLATHAAQARALLTSLPDVPARAALESLADFVVARTG